ncbi:hypothetical protein I4U23_031316 [Adineta vaga]|nr:hypothetical protein I4U23_031316 [Adineta vaga]
MGIHDATNLLDISLKYSYVDYVIENSDIVCLNIDRIGVGWLRVPNPVRIGSIITLPYPVQLHPKFGQQILPLGRGNDFIFCNQFILSYDNELIIQQREQSNYPSTIDTFILSKSGHNINFH